MGTKRRNLNDSDGFGDDDSPAPSTVGRPQNGVAANGLARLALDPHALRDCRVGDRDCRGDSFLSGRDPLRPSFPHLLRPRYSCCFSARRMGPRHSRHHSWLVPRCIFRCRVSSGVARRHHRLPSLSLASAWAPHGAANSCAARVTLRRRALRRRWRARRTSNPSSIPFRTP